MEHVCGEQEDDQPAHQKIPEDYVIEGVGKFSSFDELVELYAQTGKQMDNSQQEGEEKQLIGLSKGVNQRAGIVISVLKKRSGDHRYGIAEIASKHHTPKT